MTSEGARLDEGLDLLQRFRSGEAVNHEGRHCRVRDVTVLPASTQRSRSLASGDDPEHCPCERVLVCCFGGGVGVMLFPVVSGQRETAQRLEGRVAVVTGASRGVGKGVALGLGEAGATVYVTGRNPESGDPRGSLNRTVDEIAALGGIGVAVRCDHTDDAQVEAVFDRVRVEQGRLDVLVNNVMSTPQRDQLPAGALSQWDLHPFWEMPLWVWDAFHRVGLRSHYVASVFAAPLLIENAGGLIVCISAPGSRRYVQNVAYGVGKAGVEKLAVDMAEELRPHGVASVSLWPGFIRTEDVLGQPDVYPDLAGTFSQLFPGRAVAALAADPNVIERTGQTLKASDLASEYGFEDVETAADLRQTSRERS